MVSGSNIILASESQRRHEIIRALDVSVEIIPSGIDERSPGLTERPEAYVASIATDKADAVTANGHSEALVIGADTAVVLDERILGKPEDDIEARAMLTALRGRSHRVVTGVTAMHNDTSVSSVTSSEVTVREFSDGEMEAYIESGEPFDKAGGYAIQDEWFAPVSAVFGCYLNVVGFPLCEVIRLMSDVGVDVRLNPQWRPPQHCPTDCPVRVVSQVAVT